MLVFILGRVGTQLGGPTDRRNRCMAPLIPRREILVKCWLVGMQILTVGATLCPLMPGDRQTETLYVRDASTPSTQHSIRTDDDVIVLMGQLKEYSNRQSWGRVHASEENN